jgi:uncharacterized protein YqeY
MSLYEDIKKDYLRYRKIAVTGDKGAKVLSNAISVVLGDVSPSGNEDKNVDDAKVIKAIEKQLKGIDETLENSFGDPDKVNDLFLEMNYLKSLLPEKLDDDGIRVEIETFLADNPDSNLGNIMKYMSQNFSGKVDNKRVKEIANEYT